MRFRSKYFEALISREIFQNILLRDHQKHQKRSKNLIFLRFPPLLCFEEEEEEEKNEKKMKKKMKEDHQIIRS